MRQMIEIPFFQCLKRQRNLTFCVWRKKLAIKILWTNIFLEEAIHLNWRKTSNTNYTYTRRQLQPTWQRNPGNRAKDARDRRFLHLLMFFIFFTFIIIIIIFFFFFFFVFWFTRQLNEVERRLIVDWKVWAWQDSSNSTRPRSGSLECEKKNGSEMRKYDVITWITCWNYALTCHLFQLLPPQKSEDKYR